MRGIKINRKKNFLNSDTSHITPNPIALTNTIIKVVPSYFCGGVYVECVNNIMVKLIIWQRVTNIQTISTIKMG